MVGEGQGSILLLAAITNAPQIFLARHQSVSEYHFSALSNSGNSEFLLEILQLMLTVRIR